jgi:hypothetical protein
VDPSKYPEFLNPDMQSALNRFDKVFAEWENWSREVDQIVDQPYDRNTQAEVFADGEMMMQKHEVLQNRTLAFLNRNIKGHGFITGFDGSHCDRTDLRLKHRVKHRLQELRVLRACLADIIVEGKIVDTKLTAAKSNDVWKEIETDYDISKEQFREKINFVADSFKREIIFRDVEQAYILANSGFCKPALILSGSVIEELLRLYLTHKQITPVGNNFDAYIKTCEDKGLIKSAVHRLTDAVRHFRNLVHLEKELSSRHTISKATAKGAVSSIFTIANDFQ